MYLYYINITYNIKDILIDLLKTRKLYSPLNNKIISYYLIVFK